MHPNRIGALGLLDLYLLLGGKQRGWRSRQGSRPELIGTGLRLGRRLRSVKLRPGQATSEQRRQRRQQADRMET